MEHRPESNRSKNLKLKTAAVAGALAAAASLSGLEAPAHAETAVNRNPEILKVENRLRVITAKFRSMVKSQTGAYQETVIKEGQKVIRMVAAQKSSSNDGKFVQVVEYIKPGADLPVTIAYVQGSESRKYKESEKFAVEALLIRDKIHPNHYSLMERSYDPQTGKELDVLLEKNGANNQLYINNILQKPVTEAAADVVFEGYTTHVKGILGAIERTTKPPA